MKIDNFLQYLIPKDKKFYLLLEKASGNLLDTSHVLVEMVNSPPENRRELIKKISILEHMGDEISHEIFHELNATFITPFDREDIHALTSALDDIVDYIHGSAKRIELYKVTNITNDFIRLSELIELCAQELHTAIHELRNMKNVSKIKEACIRINSIENHADDIFDNSIARLFEEEKNAVEIIKIKEILSSLETATDKCEDAANILESIIVKSS
jgi:predicted phosphate transport protein (TIGR00153 family)